MNVIRRHRAGADSAVIDCKGGGMKTLILGILCSLLCLGPGTAPAKDAILETLQGTLIGKVESGGAVYAYKGIPYALPPVGTRRWKPAEAPRPWAGQRTASSYAPDCMQPVVPQEMRYLSGPAPLMSEDCLYLNVWTPAPPAEAGAGKKLPVMVWIHGGGLGVGSGSWPLYDGTQLARKNVVVVTFNYRLHIWGFLSHPQLSAESAKRTSGNYGIGDQVRALEWLQENIGAFGGDPDNVTVFGESGGSWSVNILMASPPARGLFHRAIGQSAAYFRPMPTLAELQSDGPSAEGLNARNVADLRNLPAADLLGLAQGTRFKDCCGLFAIVDNWLIPEPVRETFARGTQSDVPVMVGCNANESTVFGVSALEGQRSLCTPMIRWAESMHRKSSAAYVYFFRHVPPGADQKVALLPGGERVALGAFHTGEISYVFDNERFSHRFSPNIPVAPPRPADLGLASIMSDYWVSFARSGKPSAVGHDTWRPYTAEEPYFMLFDWGAALSKHPPFPEESTAQ